jgi:hypothetical protein
MKEGQDRLVTETVDDSENLVLIVTEKFENLQSFKYRSKTESICKLLISFLLCNSANC